VLANNCICITGASGARKRVAATLAEDGRAWKLALPWFEPGSHAVAVSVNGARVPSGAFSAEIQIPHIKYNNFVAIPQAPFHVPCSHALAYT
jgi:hypothetical protein